MHSRRFAGVHQITIHRGRRLEVADCGFFGRGPVGLRADDLIRGLALCNANLRANPGDEDEAVKKLRDSLTGLEEARRKAVVARQQLSQATNLRRNAGVADRPNSLRPNDNSSQQRARQMRDEADRIEEASKKAVSDAEQRVQEAQQAVEQFLAGHRSN